MSTDFATELLTWIASPAPDLPDREVIHTDLYAGDCTLHGLVFTRDGETWAAVVRIGTNGTETNVALAHGGFRRNAAKTWVTDTILLLNVP